MKMWTSAIALVAAGALLAASAFAQSTSGSGGTSQDKAKSGMSSPSASGAAKIGRAGTESAEPPQARATRQVSRTAPLTRPTLAPSASIRSVAGPSARSGSRTPTPSSGMRSSC